MSPPPKPPVGLLTVDQVAGLLQFSTDTVERLIRSGELRRFALSDRDLAGRGPGRRGYRVHPDDLAAFVDARRRLEVPPVAAPGKAATPPRVIRPAAAGLDGKDRLRLGRGRR